MKKFDRLINLYTLYALPFILVLIIWGVIDNPDRLSSLEGLKGSVWDFLGWILMIWIVSSFYLVIKLIFKKDYRDKILGRITGIKERDEREAFISGEAAKFSLLSTMGILLFLLFISLFTVKIAKHPDIERKDGKKGYVSIGMGFSVLKKEIETKAQEVSDELVYVNYQGSPLSNSMTLLLILFWQVGCYRYISRKEAFD